MQNRREDGTRVDTINVTRGGGCLETFLAKKRGETADALIPPFLRGGRILDIGCGAFPLFLLRTEFAHKYAIDKYQLDRGQVFRENGITFADHDIEKDGILPFDDEYFDVVSMLAVMEHIAPARVDDIVGEIFRILKRNGLFIATTPASWTEYLLKIMAAMNLVSKIEIEEHKATYNRRSLCSLLERANFTSGGIRTGYFEAFMNIWVSAAKPPCQASGVCRGSRA